MLIYKKDITKEQEKKLDEIINVKNNNDIINNDKNIMDLSQSLLKSLEYENEKNNRNNLFVSNYIESLYLTIKLGFFTPNEKIKLLV